MVEECSLAGAYLVKGVLETSRVASTRPAPRTVDEHNAPALSPLLPVMGEAVKESRIDGERVFFQDFSDAVSANFIGKIHCDQLKTVRAEELLAVDKEENPQSK